jgi:hypothetical protein
MQSITDNKPELFGCIYGGINGKKRKSATGQKCPNRIRISEEEILRKCPWG